MLLPVFTWQMDQMGKMFTNEFTYRTAPPSYESIGASTHPIIADLNGDNKVEVIAGSLHGGLYDLDSNQQPTRFICSI